ncbi:MAG: hypothetical protein ABJF10_04685 [Chthoniobacter sp.]|uniref:hypothetical protein n=1 Tax=Chthoniobacter sp. TaxID=2510640 RepID=UPI0032A9B72E
MKLRTLFSKTTALAVGIVALACASREARAADSQHPEISFAVQHLREENVEGPNVERTYFMAAGKRVVFGLPKGCQLSAGDGFLLLPTEAGLDGEIRVSRSSFTPETDLAAEALTYRDAATQGLPKDATHVEAKPPVMNTYPYNGWKSMGFSWTYSAYGKPMVRTVSYINLQVGVQIVVTTLAVQSDAEKVNKLARQFISSWWVMGDGAK